MRRNYTVYPTQTRKLGIFFSVVAKRGGRMVDFDKIVCYNYARAYGIEDNSAIVIENGEVVGSLSSGGKAWLLEVEEKTKTLKKTEIPCL